MVIQPFEYVERYINENPSYFNEKDFVWGVEFSFFDRWDFEEIGPVHFYKKWLNENNIDYQFNKVTHLMRVEHQHSFVYFMTYAEMKNLTKDKYNNLIEGFSFYQKQAEIMKKLNKANEDFE